MRSPAENLNPATSQSCVTVRPPPLDKPAVRESQTCCRGHYRLAAATSREARSRSEIELADGVSVVDGEMERIEDELLQQRNGAGPGRRAGAGSPGLHDLSPADSQHRRFKRGIR